MNTQKRLLASVIAASLAFGVIGCSSDSTPAAAPTAPSVVAPLAAQKAIIVISDVHSAAPVVTISTQAADITLSGEALDAGVGQLTLELKAVNNSARMLTNLKAIVDRDEVSTNPKITADAGADPTVGTSSGTFDTNDYTYFGPAIAVDGSGTSNQDGSVFQLNGIDVTATTVTMEVTLPTTHPLMVMGYWTGSPNVYLVDSATAESTELDTADTTIYAKNSSSSTGTGGGMTDGVGSIDGTKVYAGSRTTGNIFTLDLNTLNDTDPVPVTAMKISDKAVANVHKVVMNSAGTELYALVNEGSHRPAFVANGWEATSEEAHTRVVKVDIETMTVTGSVEMMRNTAMARAKDIDVAGDGVTAAVANTANGSHTVDIINLSDMTLTKTINIDLEQPFQQKINKLAISDDGATIYAFYKDIFNSDSDMLVIDVETETVTRFTLGLGIESPQDVVFGPDGLLYIATDAGLFRMNTATSLTTELDTGGSHIASITFNQAGDTVYAKEGGSGSDVYAFDVATGAQIDTDGDTTDGLIGKLTFPFNSYGHNFVLTTY